MATLPISIPQPCHESWADMQSEDKGRHCAACAQIVIDFSDWQTEDILKYLKNNKGTCGRFAVSQLNAVQEKQPIKIEEKQQNIFYYLKLIKKSAFGIVNKIAAIVILMFSLASCDNQSNAQQSGLGNSSNDSTKTKQNIPLNVDTPDYDDSIYIMGGIGLAPVKDPSTIADQKETEATAEQSSEEQQAVVKNNKTKQNNKSKNIKTSPNTEVLMGKPAFVDTTK